MSRNTGLDFYLDQIAKTPILETEEEVNLAIQIQTGETEQIRESAQEKLVSANLRFVVSIAKQYQYQGLPLGDLINEGNLGLIKAASRFDYTRGFKFISYAVWWIRQTILQALAEQTRVIRIPQNKIAESRKIVNIRALFEQEYGREPTVEEIATLAGISSTEIHDILVKTQVHTSLDDILAISKNNETFAQRIPAKSDAPDATLDRESTKQAIRDIISELTPTERKIITLYYGLDGEQLTLDQIAQIMNLTRERIRQIKEKALNKLRHPSRSNRLRNG